MDDRARKEALLEAVRELVPEQPGPAEEPRRGTGTGRPARAAASLVVSWAFLGWLWIARPAWVFGPPPPTPVTAAERDAAMRMSLWLERGRIEEFVEEHGRRPGGLEDTGRVAGEVSWIRQGSGYVLSVTLDSSTLIMSDRMDADSFLGNALEVLRR